MAIVDGQPVSAAVVNDEFVSKVTDSIIVSKVSMQKPSSGGNIDNTQKFINQLATEIGTIENNPSSLVYSSTNYINDGDTLITATGALDDQLGTTQTEVDDHESRINNLEVGTMSIGGVKTFTGDTNLNGNVLIGGNLTVSGVRTIVNSTDMQVKDRNIFINKDGDDTSAEGAGLDVQRTTDNGVFRFDSALTSKWKIGLVSVAYEILVSGIAQVITGLKSFVTGIATDTIAEHTAAAGVTIDGLLLKDGMADGRDISVDGAVQDSHIADSTIHFTLGSISHTAISNIGTNTHAQIDTHIANTSNPHAVNKAQVGLTNVTDDAQLKRAANDFNSFTEKVTPVANDVFIIEDSAASGVKKYVKYSNIGSGSSAVGSVIQTVSATYSTATSTTSSTYADTGLTLSITPASTSNKVLVMVSQNGIYVNDSGTKCLIKLLNGGSDLIKFAVTGLTTSAGENLQPSASCTYLDSPSSVSAVTYKTQFKRDVGSGSISVQFESCVSTITLMEIKG